MTAEAPLVQTRSGELSYLVGEETIRDLPLNGRNYTDLALLQPGVVAYPHRDGGSVVAHGLGMSINGQDPRSNVYLLDGTPLNDFTNGPAGCAACTVLGIETIREFRVETNAYGAEFGRNSGGQINALTKSGTQRSPRQRLRVPPQRQPRRPQLLRSRREARLQAQPVRRHHRRPDPTRPHVLLRRLRRACASGWAAPSPPSCPTTSARAASCPAWAPSASTRRWRPTSTTSRSPTARAWAAASPCTLRLRPDPGPGLRPGPARPEHRRPDQFFVRYTRDDAEQHLPTDFPQFPRRSSPATSS